MTALQLIESIRQIKARRLPELRCLRALWQTLNELAMNCNEINLNLADLTPGVYTRHLLNSFDDDFHVVLLLWGPGASTSIHDHDSAMGAVMPIVGSVYETKYRILQSDRHHAKLEMMESVHLDTLSLTPILPGDEMQVHQMENASAAVAATLHVYLSPLKDFYIYHPTDDGRFTLERKDLLFEQDNEWWILEDCGAAETA